MGIRKKHTLVSFYTCLGWVCERVCVCDDGDGVGDEVRIKYGDGDVDVNCVINIWR